MSPKVSLLGIIGPTGIGKSDVAISLARRIPGEIVCVDSMQVYRGVDCGTGKPSAQALREIPHHGINLVEPEQEFNVARYLEFVRPAIESIRNKGKIPILAGGSGLYFRGLRRGLSSAPGENPVLREQLTAQAHAEGVENLHAKLQRVDPAASGRIHSNDLRRIVRALEVFLSTGKPLTAWHQESEKQAQSQKQGRIFFGLRCAREMLYRRIEDRIDRWLSDGWLEEAQELSKRKLSRTAGEALGYQELFSYLRGELDWETTVARIKQNSRRYAKRQETWFRREPGIQWIDVDGKNPEQAADMVMSKL